MKLFRLRKFNPAKMKFTKLATALLFTIIFSENIFSQVGQNQYYKQDFLQLFDSLVHPPENCETAFSNILYDSVKKEILLEGKLKDQYDLILNLYSYYDTESQKAEKKKFALPENPGGTEPPKSGPPPNGNGPPGGIGIVPDGAKEIMEDINSVNLIIDNIIVNTEKYKNELKKSVSKLNEELKSTMQSDYSGRLIMANDFLTSQQTDYNKYYLLFRNNMSKVNEIVKKYNNGENLKFPPLKNDILRIQTVMISNIKFLITITKEFSLTGAKFYIEDKEK